MRTPFVSAVELDDRLIEDVEMWPVWEVLEHDNPRRDTDLTFDDLALLTDGDRLYLKCLALAHDDADRAQQYYENVPLSTIYKQHALQIVRNYRPPLKPARSRRDNDFE